MRKTYHKFTVIPLKGLFLSGALFFASCTHEEEHGQDMPSILSDAVSFGVEIPEGWNAPVETRSVPQTAASLSKTVEVGETPDGEKILICMTVDEGIEAEPKRTLADADTMTRASEPLPAADELDFGVFAYLMDRTGSTAPEYDGSGTEQFMYNNPVDVSEGYSYSPVKYWPGDAYWLKFFAYRPYEDFVNALKPDASVPDYLTVDGSSGVPEIHYTVPKEVDLHTDLLATSTDMIEGDYRQTVNLPFRHLLSAVKFMIGTMPGAVINHVALNGIRNDGIYTDWSAAGMSVAGTGTENFIQDFTVDENGNTIAGLDADANSGRQLGGTFYMIPQNFSDDASKLKINVSFNKKNSLGEILSCNTYDLERPVKDFVGSWDANKTYTYTVSTPNEVSVSISDTVIGKVKSDIVIMNNGLATVFIRATIVGYWVVDDPNVAGGYEIVAEWDSDKEGTFDWGTNMRNPSETKYWRKGSDGFYYYMTPLRRGEKVAVPIFESYTLTANPPIPDAELELTIAGQAVIVTDISKMKEGGWDHDVVDILEGNINLTQE